MGGGPGGPGIEKGKVWDEEIVKGGGSTVVGQLGQIELKALKIKAQRVRGGIRVRSTGVVRAFGWGVDPKYLWS